MDTPAKSPEFIEIELPAATEDRQAPIANFVNVGGGGDVFTLDFFFVPDSKIARILGGKHEGLPLRVEGETAHLQVEPVARATLPLSAATELAADLFEKIAQKVPELQGVLDEFNKRMQSIGEQASSSLEGEGEDGAEGDGEDG
ncbi:MAG: hypothetical protein U0359_39545 [Byssovorax sp.]